EHGARRLEYRATFAGFELVQQPTGLDSFGNLQSNRSAVPANKFQVSGKNYARYMNPDLDELVSNYFVTVPRPARLSIAEQIIHHVSDQVVWMTLYYSPDAAAIGNRMQ